MLKVPTPQSASTPQSADEAASATAVWANKRKKESKKERRARVAGEIYQNMLRIKEALDRFRENCLFCQQTCYVSVDTIFLLTHLNIVHDQVLLQIRVSRNV